MAPFVDLSDCVEWLGATHPELVGLRVAVRSLGTPLTETASSNDDRLQPVYCLSKLFLSSLAYRLWPDSTKPLNAIDLGIPEFDGVSPVDLVSSRGRVLGITVQDWRMLPLSKRSLRSAIGSSNDLSGHLRYSELAGPLVAETALRSLDGYERAVEAEERLYARTAATSPAVAQRAVATGNAVPNYVRLVTGEYRPVLAELHPTRLGEISPAVLALANPAGIAHAASHVAAQGALIDDAESTESIDSRGERRLRGRWGMFENTEALSLGWWGDLAVGLPVGMLVGGVVVSPEHGLAIAALSRRLVADPPEQGVVMRRIVFEALGELMR